MDARHVVEKAFSQSQKCYHHCDQPATLRFLDSGEPLVACYACPTGYVSKVMVYGHRDVDKTMREFLANALGGRPLREDEVRTATRHPWDLAIRDFEMSVAYWTQNYRGSKSEDPHRPALFICSNCNSTYVKPLSMPGTMCPNCRS